jgi:hypothetical protein
MAKTLVIVESPTKARTLERFLGDQYQVKASFGHVRDLPDSAREVPDEIRKKKWGRLGVDTDGDFKPYYVIPDDKRKNVAELRTALKGAAFHAMKTYVATPENRQRDWVLFDADNISILQGQVGDQLNATFLLAAFIYTGQVLAPTPPAGCPARSSASSPRPSPRRSSTASPRCSAASPTTRASTTPTASAP